MKSQSVEWVAAVNCSDDAAGNPTGLKAGELMSYMGYVVS